MKICLVNGSPRGKKSSSSEFLKGLELELADRTFETKAIQVGARVEGGYPAEVLEGLSAADAIVLVFPLYNYGLPGALMRLLEDYHRFVISGSRSGKAAKVYAVVNCGYPRPEITAEAIRVVKNYCRRLSLNWRFAVRIGTGPVVVATRRLPLVDCQLKKAWAEMAADIGSDALAPRADCLIKPVIPEPIIRLIKNYYEWKGQMIQGDRKPAPGRPHPVSTLSESRPTS